MMGMLIATIVPAVSILSFLELAAEARPDVQHRRAQQVVSATDREKFINAPIR
jgi:hypothetical protein